MSQNLSYDKRASKDVKNVCSAEATKAKESIVRSVTFGQIVNFSKIYDFILDKSAGEAKRNKQFRQSLLNFEAIKTPINVSVEVPCGGDGGQATCANIYFFKIVKSTQNCCWIKNQTKL